MLWERRNKRRIKSNWLWQKRTIYFWYFTFAFCTISHKQQPTIMDGCSKIWKCLFRKVLLCIVFGFIYFIGITLLAHFYQWNQCTLHILFDVFLLSALDSKLEGNMKNIWVLKNPTSIWIVLETKTKKKTKIAKKNFCHFYYWIIVRFQSVAIYHSIHICREHFSFSNEQNLTIFFRHNYFSFVVVIYIRWRDISK